jgi:iron(III) transport system substrate-binding protein
MPKSWRDLTDPVYKGHIVAASPVSSSTAYACVFTWLRSMGEEKGWQFMESLNKNVAQYTHSGCKPAQMAAQGEFPIGISAPTCAKPYVDKKAPLALVVPEEGASWDLESAALVKGSKKPEEAKKLLDFATSAEVARIGLENGYIPARADAATEFIEKVRKALLPMDPTALAAMRQSVLAQWRSRFE